MPLNLRKYWKPLAAAVLAACATCAAYAVETVLKPIDSQTVKIAYFNFGKVRAALPEVANAEVIRITAEAQLRKDVETWNARLIKLREDKKPQAEIDKTKNEAQTIIRAKQEALAQLVESASLSVRVRIASAAEAVARDQNIDLVLDGQGIYSGGQRVFDHGRDITSAVLARVIADSDAKNVDAPAVKDSGSAK